jgi:hypothetical protein
MIRSVGKRAVLIFPWLTGFQSPSFSLVPSRVRSWLLSALDGVLPLVLVLHHILLILFGMFLRVSFATLVDIVIVVA